MSRRAESLRRAASVLAPAMRMLVPVALLCAGGRTALAQEDYLYCSIFHESPERTVFYGEVFHGDWRLASEYESEFRDFLQAGGHAPDPDRGYCFWEDTPGAASRERRKEIEEDRSDGYRIVQTGWIPGAARAAPGSMSSVRYGSRDSGGDGCYFGECPDGGAPLPTTPGPAPIPGPRPPVTPPPPGQLTLICQTSMFWCQLPVPVPVGSFCGCYSMFGQPFAGLTVPMTP